ncbi:MAG: D-2-hydroxyacid dehydrogenase [Desulfovibrio sp.]
MKIVILDGYTMGSTDLSCNPLEKLGDFTYYDRSTPEKVLTRAKEAEIVVVNKIIMSREVIDALPKLRCIAVSATGYNTVDLEAAAERDITVCNVPGYSSPSAAQFTFALILELCSKVSEHHQAVLSGEWGKSPDFCFWNSPLIELQGKTLGVVGYGDIGRHVAKLGHAFGMKILAYAPRPKEAPDYAPFEFVELEALLKKADIISTHCPLTADNERFINDSTIEKMKSGVMLINTARGPLIDEGALIKGLQSGKIGGAALDVVTLEPLPDSSPLLTAPNCIITPHIAWATKESRNRLLQTCADNIQAFIAGIPQNKVS